MGRGANAVRVDQRMNELDIMFEEVCSVLDPPLSKGDFEATRIPNVFGSEEAIVLGTDFTIRLVADARGKKAYAVDVFLGGQSVRLLHTRDKKRVLEIVCLYAVVENLNQRI